MATSPVVAKKKKEEFGTHLICLDCWVKIGNKLTDTPQPDDEKKPCCFCGKPTPNNLFVRAAASEVKCGIVGGLFHG